VSRAPTPAAQLELTAMDSNRETMQPKNAAADSNRETKKPHDASAGAVPDPDSPTTATPGSSQSTPATESPSDLPFAISLAASPKTPMRAPPPLALSPSPTTTSPFPWGAPGTPMSPLPTASISPIVHAMANYHVSPTSHAKSMEVDARNRNPFVDTPERNRRRPWEMHGTCGPCPSIRPGSHIDRQLTPTMITLGLLTPPEKALKKRRLRSSFSDLDAAEIVKDRGDDNDIDDDNDNDKNHHLNNDQGSNILA
jgi:hypothetical protein